MTTDEFLEHHGIKGQKWGVRRFQNKDGSYTAIGKKRRNGDNSEDYKKIESLNKDLNKATYGVLINGKVEEDPNKIDWGKYKTCTVDEFKKYKAGVCWDFVNYQHDFFKKNGIKDSSYFFVMQNGENPWDIVTHTFSIVNGDDKQYWFESSWEKHQGVREVKSYKDVVDVLKKEYGSEYAYDLYSYDPEGMDQHLSNGDFFKKASENLIYQNDKEIKHSIFEEINFDDFNKPEIIRKIIMNTVTFIDTERVYDTLEHHGIKGQRWSIRRTPEQLGRKVSKLKEKTSKLEQKSIDKEKKANKYSAKYHKNYDKVLSSVSDAVNSGRDFLANFLEDASDTIRPKKK